MHNNRIFTLIKESPDFPSLPEKTNELLTMLNNPKETDVDLLSKKILEYSAFHNYVMENINSGFYNIRREIPTIKDAVIYLGVKTIYILFIHFITKKFFPIKKRKTNYFSLECFWNHCIGTSVASKMIAEKLGNDIDIYKIFAYGLIHDIGIAVLNHCLPEILDDIFIEINKGTHQILAEKKVMDGISHTEIGGWLCREWGISDEITNIVEFHHTPYKSNEFTYDLKILFLGDWISTLHFQGLLGKNESPEVSLAVAKDLNLSNETVREIGIVLPEEINKNLKYFPM